MNMHMAIDGQYRCRVFKSRSGVQVKDTGWFDNLILNSGLDMIGSEFTNHVPRHTRFIKVGSDSTPPLATNTQLGNEIASTDSGDNLTSKTFDDVGRFSILRRTATFSNGSAAGNLSEVGAGRGSTQSIPLFSRALIRDQNGDPTTITVLSDEDLVVDYRYRMKQPVGVFSGSIPNSYLTYTGNVLGLNNTSSWIRHDESWVPSSTFCRVGSGTELLEPTVAGMGTDLGFDNATSVIMDPYVGGSHQISGQLFYDTNKANGDLQLFGYFSSSCQFQFLLSEPITKTNLDTLRIKFTLSWGRYTA